MNGVVFMVACCGVCVKWCAVCSVTWCLPDGVIRDVVCVLLDVMFGVWCGVCDDC